MFARIAFFCMLPFLSFSELSNVWGFHVHFDLDKNSEATQFPETLRIQKALINYLQEEQIPLARSSIFDPGYGPHRNWSWEARIEPAEKDIKTLSHNLGKVINWIVYNGDPNMWLHLLTHDESREDFLTEFVEHNELRMFFGPAPNLDLNFFLEPPRDENHKVIDTKTPNEWTLDKVQMVFEGLLIEKTFPIQAKEFHIHIHQGETIANVVTSLEVFLQEQQITPKKNRYLANGYEIQLEGETATDFLGEIITFLMVNRQGLAISIYPVSEFLKIESCIIRD